MAEVQLQLFVCPFHEKRRVGMNNGNETFFGQASGDPDHQLFPYAYVDDALPYTIRQVQIVERGHADLSKYQDHFGIR